MARRLRTYVHVDGVAYGPDDEVPAEVAKRIGDHAWEGADSASSPSSSSSEQTATGTASASKRTAAKRTATRKE